MRYDARCDVMRCDAMRCDAMRRASIKLYQGRHAGLTLETPRTGFTTAALRDLMGTHPDQNWGNYSVITQSSAPAQLRTPSDTLTTKPRFGKAARARSVTQTLVSHCSSASQNEAARSSRARHGSLTLWLLVAHLFACGWFVLGHRSRCLLYDATWIDAIAAWKQGGGTVYMRTTRRRMEILRQKVAGLEGTVPESQVIERGRPSEFQC